MMEKKIGNQAHERTGNNFQLVVKEKKGPNRNPALVYCLSLHPPKTIRNSHRL
jgi:hypothetical protein